MKKTGSLLKSKREAANLSLSEVALATKINPKVLTAIENGDEKNLPAKTFLKGFIKSYALFLKMDVEEVMNVFQEETGGARPATQHPVEQTRNEPPQSSRRRVSDENSSGMRTVAVVVIVILIGMIIGVRELIEKYQREKVVESPVALKATPVEVKPEAKPVVEAPAAEEPKAENGEAKAPEEKVAEVKPEEPAKPVEPVKIAEPAKPEPPKHAEAAKPAEPVAETKYPEFKPEVKPLVIPTSVFPNLVEVRSSKPVDKKPEEDKSNKSQAEAKKDEKPVEAAKPATPEPTKEAAKPAEPAKPAEAPKTAASNKPDPSSAAVTPSSPLKAVKNEIILEALDKVEVKFQVGGETKRVSLAPQEVHTIRADKPLTLDLSDGGAVNIILNGKDRGPAGDLGKPATIKLP